jgi:hypothetical protein
MLFFEARYTRLLFPFTGLCSSFAETRLLINFAISKKIIAKNKKDKYANKLAASMLIASNGK